VEDTFDAKTAVAVAFFVLGFLLLPFDLLFDDDFDIDIDLLSFVFFESDIFGRVEV